ncbi:uncharacterized protein LAESUDRAFT_662002 [Laetiporus sulphureus 93-53]|uniref:SWIM-type domain-containing protein n=1 Tax=Laetiporus sulphureus 93-53 TaxID=1314785 RepID=A0A165C7E4_9APHY|nr:uncharacterized protein LAESUDRAFT_662002 [Laetiporus sulphureus 93-53]KZT02331.1 hypothetical protein LAESUDRAFT_662002 [Laetiporus sulphureus 93-53]
MQRNIWQNLSVKQASGEKGGLTSHSIASEVYIQKLMLNEGQKKAIVDLYAGGQPPLSREFHADNQSEQRDAAALLAMHDLDWESQKTLANRWSVRWTRVSGEKKKATQMRRVLLQCDCGYDHTIHGSKKRHTAFDFTGCLAHAEITLIVASRAILHVRGFLDHNLACQEALIARIPKVPLHPSVYHITLEQLEAGATLSDIQDRNRSLVSCRSYPEMSSSAHYDVKAPFRWFLEASDTRSLYRQHNRMHGVDTTVPAHINIDEWLDLMSPRYNSVLADAVFHYSPRASRGEHFEVCIATLKMREAAWQYANKSQIILDGTFGICDKKILLFIIMAIDEERKGIPLAFLQFSAPSGNHHTAAGYNTEVLERLLKKWKNSLEKSRSGPFMVYVAITDTDLMERGALVSVFSGIWLLICKFHLCQSWWNHRNKAVKGNSPAHLDIKNQLRRVEVSLIETMTLDDAHTIIQQEINVLETMRDADEHSSIAEKGITHLRDYLLNYWTTDALWQSWSNFGRQKAATILDCDLKGVLLTTNHLESFNGVLKRKHSRRWQRGGRRLCVDVLLSMLVSQILPSVISQREMEAEAAHLCAEQIYLIPGGHALLKKNNGSQHTDEHAAYLEPDCTRDEAATALFAHRQIGSPTVDATGSILTFSCYSSLALASEDSSVMYTVTLHMNGTGQCSCRDFASCGGACKHMRAALLKLEDIQQQGTAVPKVWLPESADHAQLLLRAQQTAMSVAEIMPKQSLSIIDHAAAAVEDTIHLYLAG